MNIAEATLRKADGRITIELDRGETSLVVPEAALGRYPRAADYDGRTVAVGIRPEHFAQPETVDASQVWKGRRVSLVEMLGAEMLVHFHTDSPPIVSEDMKAAIDDDEAFEELQRKAASGGQEFTARFDPGNPPKVDAQIDVGVRTDELHFFDPESGVALR